MSIMISWVWVSDFTKSILNFLQNKNGSCFILFRGFMYYMTLSLQYLQNASLDIKLCSRISSFFFNYVSNSYSYRVNFDVGMSIN